MIEWRTSRGLLVILFLISAVVTGIALMDFDLVKGLRSLAVETAQRLLVVSPQPSVSPVPGVAGARSDIEAQVPAFPTQELPRNPKSIFATVE
ncbi:MAG: hypothetical protein Q8P73_02515 [bacterium]|nr:hypothetical protein [bacterium]